MDATMKIQAQIRQNAEEVSSYLSQLSSWQNSIKKKDQGIVVRATNKAESAPRTASVNGKSEPILTSWLSGDVAPVRKGVGTVPTVALAPDGKSSSAANHTYDIGYKKWENFNVDAALAEEDGIVSIDTSCPTPPRSQSQSQSQSSQHQQLSKDLNPTTIIPPQAVTTEITPGIPAARGVFVHADAEAAEREIGNKEFANGNFSAAVKSYTKCLGLKSRNYIAFSNRAMAYLKLKEFHRAESDCTNALSLCPTHTKSLLRRATARNALGKHRAALADLFIVQDEDPTNKQARGEIQRTKEALLSAVNRAPMIPLTIELDEDAVPVAGPDLPL